MELLGNLNSSHILYFSIFVVVLFAFDVFCNILASCRMANIMMDNYLYECDLV